MKDLEECINNKEVGKLLDMLLLTQFDNKLEIIKHLRKNPFYKCYFCDGFNYNCEAYETFIK